MYCIIQPSNNPYFNIALEDYLLRESTLDFVVLYTDAPSVIVGKHQNTLAEINYRFVTENSVPVVRRISGGGTVYHDLGNLNFCFINNADEGAQVNFIKHTQPVITALKKFGIDASFEGKNDLKANGYKISGNAGHVFKNRVLHHGTLLVNANLNWLSEALRVTPGLYTDKAVKSIRSNVANLCNFVPNINIETLQYEIIAQLKQKNNLCDYCLSADEIASIEANIAKKFSTCEWNFDYSPDYVFSKNDIELHVKKGVIFKAIIKNNDKLSAALIGHRHLFSEIMPLVNAGQMNIWDFF